MNNVSSPLSHEGAFLWFSFPVTEVACNKRLVYEMP